MQRSPQDITDSMRCVQATRSAQKSALTRAVNSGKRENVYNAVAQTVKGWNRCGSWPDDWSRWQRALTDAGYRIDLTDLD